MTINVLITDDHPLVITGLRNTLAAHAHIQFMGGCTSGAELLERLDREQPDVLLLDIQLPDQSGNQLARVISANWPEIRILALSGMDSSFHVMDMLHNGCTGYLLKHTDEQTLIRAIEDVHAGIRFIDPSLKEMLLQNMMKTSKRPTLTEREKEILQLIATGHTSGDISKQLSIALRTVENHRFSIMQKMDCKNTASLIRLALETGLVK